MGLRSAWSPWSRMPAQDLSELAPEERETLIALAQASGGQGYLDALPQKRATREASAKHTAETKKVELEKELGPEILSNPAFSAIKTRAEDLPVLLKQAQGVDDLTASLEEFRREPQPPERIDWTPLLRFSERLGGRVPTTKYIPPPTPPTALERRQIELKLQDLIQRRRESEAITQLKAMFGQKIPQQVVATSGTTQTAGGEKGDKTVFLTQTPMTTGKGAAAKAPKPADTRDLSKRLEDLPGIIGMAKKLQPYLHGKDIPGISVGQKLVPDFWRSDAGSSVRQLAEGIIRKVIKMDSGKVATKQEVEGKKRELGIDFTQSDAAFKRGLSNLVDYLEATARQVEAGYTPETLKEFTARGGMGSARAVSEVRSAFEGSGKTPRNMKPANEMTKEEILKELQSYGVKK